MQEITVLQRPANSRSAVIVESNLVKIAGTVKDGADTLAERTVQIYRSGTSELIESVISDSSDGKFEKIFPGEITIKLRVLAFAKKGESDERTKVFDFVNAKQITFLY